MSLVLICLLVSNNCTPLGFPFPIKILRTNSVVILQRRSSWRTLSISAPSPHLIWRFGSRMTSFPAPQRQPCEPRKRFATERFSNECNAIEIDTAVPSIDSIHQIPCTFGVFMLLFSCRQSSKCPPWKFLPLSPFRLVCIRPRMLKRSHSRSLQ
ncbi:hypothetical protein B0F90DRAFT_1004180 [Multifurca ochricompacta]|uniref:Secreted protein n=1 Tax=Multifurca ochricompacta TaxID=376703 RepID=A0AAD4M0B4_9AGAM|nr:hypothetical protein B0F90DRAFT_1004180 [Multifurca ochricompacta]